MERMGFPYRLTNRLTETAFECVSLQEVHCTVKVYQNGVASVSFGRRLVTLWFAYPLFSGGPFVIKEA